MAHIFKKLASLSLVAALSVLLVQCGDHDGDLGASISNNYFDDVYTLQGAVFNANTGARIGGEEDDFQIYLIENNNIHTPDRLERSGVLSGEYAFYDLPITLHGNATYRIVVVATDFQQFEGVIANNAAYDGSTGGTTTTALQNANNWNNTFDTDYTVLGNIYIYPVGSEATDFEVIVRYDGERVEGATVVLEQDAASNRALLTENNRIGAASGYLPVLTGTTDSDGSAVFDGADLVLGGAYNVTVLPVVYEGVNLDEHTGTQILVGSTDSDDTLGDENAPVVQVIDLLDSVPGTDDDGLFVVSASNEDDDDVTGSTNAGQLVLVFNRDIQINNNEAGDLCTAALTGATTATLDPDPEDQVDISYDSDTFTLTLTPVFTVDPDEEDDAGLFITYTCPVITLAGDDEFDSFDITELEFADGNAVSAVVNIFNSLN